MALPLTRCKVLVMMIAFALVAAPVAAQQAKPSMSRSPGEAVGEIPPTDEATQGQAVARKTVVGQHAVLVPYEQCGGEKGLCNTTTIGVPCGDHPWGLDCPTDYECKRKTAAVWQCIPGKQAAANGSTADPQLVVPVSNSSLPTWEDVTKAESSNTSTATTPEVRSCPPGAIAVGSRCFKNAAGSRKAIAGTLAGSMALLAAWQLAIVLITALLSC